MLYNKKFSPKLFKKPTSEYRGTPFWAWNCALEKDELLRQIDIFKEMGLGGFHMHSRTGTVTPYLSEEFMDLVKLCRDKAEKEEMLCWLYDEDRWPSGAAGGLVTKDPQYRARYLLFTPWSNQEYGEMLENDDISAMKASRNNQGTLLARYEINLEKGYLINYRRLKEGEPGANVWYAYREITSPSSWFNNQTYLDTLNPRAVDKFIETTHEKYKEAVGQSFGKSVPAIFTDEPQFTHKTELGFASEKKDVFLPYTDDLDDTFKAAYGNSLLDVLPEVIWNLPENKISQNRYNYHDHVAERFAAAFADRIGSWCKKNNLMLSGHMMEEPTLKSQSAALGDCMRSYRSFQLPGIDMLCDWREYSTAKQAQSAAHQYGAPGVLSELYGVTNWDFDFRGHKLQGDWQAALGVTVRVQHLSWVSMGGEAKRDYPASISYQSPWYKEYPLIEDHFARVNTAMTSGKPSVKIGVIHPVESYWINMGPLEQTGAIRQELDDNFANTVDWLLHEHLDFDFIAESLIPEQADYSGKGLPSVGSMSYETILVPDCRILRTTTIEFLKTHLHRGGRVVFSGNIAEEAQELIAHGASVKVSHARSALSQALSSSREISLKNSSGQESNKHIYQLRRDGEKAYLFIAPSRRPKVMDIPRPEIIRIEIQGNWDLTLLDTMSGSQIPLESESDGQKTWYERKMDMHDSLLLLLEPKKNNTEERGEKKITSSQNQIKEIDLPQSWHRELSEPNVLVLDRTEWSLDKGAFQKASEILKADDKMREILNWPSRSNRVCQPWAAPEYTGEPHRVHLRYTINSQIMAKEITLALEEPEDTEVILNGKKIPLNISGWYVDKAIKTVELGDLPAGKSILEIKKNYIPSTNLENMFILGEFDVALQGSEAVITAPENSLYFGSWVNQGLPFYGGNVIYKTEVDLKPGRYSLQASFFRAPLLKLSVNGKESPLAFSPYRAEFTIEKEGPVTLAITAFGSRINTFGQLHICNRDFSWWGPPSFRTEGESWSEEYQLREAGIMKAPELQFYPISPRSKGVC